MCTRFTLHSIVTVMDHYDCVFTAMSIAITGILSGVCASFSIYIYFVMSHAEINSAALSAVLFTASL